MQAQTRTRSQKRQVLKRRAARASTGIGSLTPKSMPRPALTPGLYLAQEATFPSSVACPHAPRRRSTSGCAAHRSQEPRQGLLAVAAGAGEAAAGARPFDATRVGRNNRGEQGELHGAGVDDLHDAVAAAEPRRRERGEEGALHPI